ncbi:MAG: class I fructose-bisphosphate aldolase [Pirellulales bacterium]
MMIETPLRLRRILDPRSGRALLLSFTSGMEIGIAGGLSDVRRMAVGLAATSLPTGLIVHAGVVESLFERQPNLPCGIVVDLFGGTWMTTQPYQREQICSLEHAVRVGADAVLMTLGLGSPDEARQLRQCGEITRECAYWGLPLLLRVDTAETDSRRQFSATLCGHGARLGYEIGASAVIVHYPGDSKTFHEVIQGIDIPVIIGGAPNMATDAAMLSSIGDGIRAGANGAALNGAMFWSDGPMPLLDQVAKEVAG